jgi:hypothetical protein
MDTGLKEAPGPPAFVFDEQLLSGAEDGVATDT